MSNIEAALALPRAAPLPGVTKKNVQMIYVVQDHFDSAYKSPQRSCKIAVSVVRGSRQYIYIYIYI